ncbi:MAG: HIT family protein [Bacteroidota bacterium]
MASIFTKIINGDIPCYKIAEDEKHFAFLDINPNAEGHTLCVTKKEVDKIWDLSEEEYLGLMRFSKKIAHAVEAAISCERVGMTVIGLEVPHVHVHLIPLKSMANATFQHKVKLDTDQFADIAQKIQMELK